MSKYVNVVKVKVKPSLRNKYVKLDLNLKAKHLHCLWKLQSLNFI